MEREREKNIKIKNMTKIIKITHSPPFKGGKWGVKNQALIPYLLYKC